MTWDEALAVLGVTREDGRDVVRRAYLRLIRTHRPERDPEGFRRVRAAWEVWERDAPEGSTHVPPEERVPDVIARATAPRFAPSEHPDPLDDVPDLDLTGARDHAEAVGAVEAAAQAVLDGGRDLEAMADALDALAAAPGRGPLDVERVVRAILFLLAEASGDGGPRRDLVDAFLAASRAMPWREPPPSWVRAELGLPSLVHPEAAVVPGAVRVLFFSFVEDGDVETLQTRCRAVAAGDREAARGVDRWLDGAGAVWREDVGVAFKPGASLTGGQVTMRAGIGLLVLAVTIWAWGASMDEPRMAFVAVGLYVLWSRSFLWMFGFSFGDAPRGLRVWLVGVGLVMASVLVAVWLFAAEAT